MKSLIFLLILLSLECHAWRTNPINPKEYNRKLEKLARNYLDCMTTSLSLFSLQDKPPSSCVMIEQAIVNATKEYQAASIDVIGKEGLDPAEALSKKVSCIAKMENSGYGTANIEQMSDELVKQFKSNKMSQFEQNQYLAQTSVESSWFTQLENKDKSEATNSFRGRSPTQLYGKNNYNSFAYNLETGCGADRQPGRLNVPDLGTKMGSKKGTGNGFGFIKNKESLSEIGNEKFPGTNMSKTEMSVAASLWHWTKGKGNAHRRLLSCMKVSRITKDLYGDLSANSHIEKRDVSFNLLQEYDKKMKKYERLGKGAPKKACAEINSNGVESRLKKDARKKKESRWYDKDANKVSKECLDEVGEFEKQTKC